MNPFFFASSCPALVLSCVILLSASSPGEVFASQDEIIPCPDEEAAMYSCMYGDSNLLAAMDCEACLAAAVPDQVIHYCQELVVACDAIPACPCAPCGDVILAYVSCALRNMTAGCNVNCTAAETRVQVEESTGLVCEGLGCTQSRNMSSNGGESFAIVACQTERVTYRSCLQLNAPTGTETTTISCELCLASTVPMPGSGATCEDYQTSVCSAIDTDCRSVCSNACVHELESYLQCSFTNQLQSACSVVCVGIGTTERQNPNDLDCSEQVDSLTACLLTNEPGSEIIDSCPSCVVEAFGSDPSEIECERLSNEVCPALAECDCGSCTPNVEGYFACIAAATTKSCAGTECDLAIPGGSENDAICTSTIVELRQCLLLNELGTGLYEACPSCVLNSFPDGTSPDSVPCDTLNTDVCVSMKSCDCGSCTENVGRYFDCVAANTSPSCSQGSYDTCFGGPPTAASLTPSASPSTTAPSPAPSASALGTGTPSPSPLIPPSAAPVPGSDTPTPSASPSGGAPAATGACNEREKRMHDCLIQQLAVPDQNCVNCVDAVDEALQNPLLNCPSISSPLCEILTGVCSCGDCTPLVNSYYSCAIAQKVANCTVDCGSTAPSQSITSSSSFVQPSLGTQLAMLGGLMAAIWEFVVGNYS
jgi:hypothetical protein